MGYGRDEYNDEYCDSQNVALGRGHTWQMPSEIGSNCV